MSISFACPRCKRSLKVPEQLAGKKAKCPHCSSSVGVPANGAVRAAAPAASGPVKHNPKVEFAGMQRQVTSPTGAGKAYKRERGNPVMKLMIVTLLLFLLGGGIYGAARFKLVDFGALLVKIGLKSAPTTEVAEGPADTKPKAGPADTGKTTQPQTTAPVKEAPPPPLSENQFFPDGTLAIASLNFESALNSKPYDKIKEELVKLDKPPEKLFDAVVKPYLGLQLTATSRVTVAMAAQQDTAFVVRPRNPVTIDEVKLNKKGDYKEVKVGRFTMYEGAMDGYCLAEERLLVVAPPALLKKILERNKPPELKPDLEAAYKLLNPAKTISLVLTAQTSELAKAGAPIPKELESAGDLAKTLVLQLDLAQGLEVSATLICKDADAAAAVKKAADGLVAMAKMKLEQVQKDSEQQEEIMRAKKAEEVVGQIKVATEGAYFTVTLNLNDETVAQLLEMNKGFLAAAPGQ
jgi:DNA-directed RNA polymerase subunit RPC12/RpoP